MRRLITATTVLLLSGCNFAPQHSRPGFPAPSSFPVSPEAGAAAPELAWQEFFIDPQLRRLIGTALDRNRDMAIAVARIEEARGLYRIQGAARLPNVTAGAEATRSGGAPDTEPVDRFGISIGVTSFELDFWGRVRNLDEAARSRFLATVEARRAFELSLIGQVASSYLASREIAERIRLAEATVESRRAGLQIVQRRLAAGVTTSLDVSQAESLLTQAETELAGLRLAAARNVNALTVLVGGSMPSDMPAPLSLIDQLGLARLAEGLPSDLLTSRPDILGAEEQLRAARADIGAARAAFFPTISLTGMLGFASNALENLISSDNRGWSAGASAGVPIFSGGRVSGNVTVARAREEMAVANYERTVQEAFREVADALAGRRYLTEQVAAQERNTAAQRRISELAAIRYREGVTGYLQVLDAERNLFAAEQALLQLRRAEAENLVRLYLALGGGSISNR